MTQHLGPPGPERPSAGGSRLRRLAPLSGLALLVLLGSRVDLAAVAEAMAGMPLGDVAVAAGFYCLNLALKAYRWHRMARQLDVRVAARVSLAAFLGGCFWGCLTIGRLGEFWRVEALFAHARSRLEALSTCLVDRGLDLAFLVAAAASGLAWQLATPGPAWRALVPLLAAPSLALGLYAVRVLTRRASAKPTAEAASGGRLGRELRRLSPLWSACGQLCWGRGTLGSVALTALSWTAYAACVHSLARGLSLGVDSATLAFATAVSALASALPISFQGIGTRDGTFALLLGREGVSPAQALSLSLATLALFYAVTLPLGALGVVARSAQRTRALRAPGDGVDR